MELAKTIAAASSIPPSSDLPDFLLKPGGSCTGCKSTDNTSQRTPGILLIEEFTQEISDKIKRHENGNDEPNLVKIKNSVKANLS
ncbi:MAG: hypothetical protein R2784_16710 [Saprospiraceae bacterium]